MPLIFFCLFVSPLFLQAQDSEFNFKNAGDYNNFIMKEMTSTGIWVGAVLSLALGIILSRKAIKIHQLASPFKPVLPDGPVGNNSQNG